jgi:hypothetical protein
MSPKRHDKALLEALPFKRIDATSFGRMNWVKGDRGKGFQEN